MSQDILILIKGDGNQMVTTWFDNDWDVSYDEGYKKPYSYWIYKIQYKLDIDSKWNYFVPGGFQYSNNHI